MAMPTSNAGTMPVATLPERDRQVIGLEIKDYLPPFITEETQTEFRAISSNQIWNSICNCSMHPDDPQAQLQVIGLFRRVRITFVESLIPVGELIQWQAMREKQLQKQMAASYNAQGDSADEEMYERLRRSEAAIQLLEEFNRSFDVYPEVFERLQKDLMLVVDKTRRKTQRINLPLHAICKERGYIDYNDSFPVKENEENIASVIKRRFERYSLTDMVAEIEELGDEIHAMAADQTSVI